MPNHAASFIYSANSNGVYIRKLPAERERTAFFFPKSGKLFEEADDIIGATLGRVFIFFFLSPLQKGQNSKVDTMLNRRLSHVMAFLLS